MTLSLPDSASDALLRLAGNAPGVVATLTLPTRTVKVRYGPSAIAGETAMAAASFDAFQRRPVTAFVSGAGIGTLGGLIGLGGAEFRLPFLIGMFRFGALEAVIIKKAMSLRHRPSPTIGR
jgi:hypothetical protein